MTHTTRSAPTGFARILAALVIGGLVAACAAQPPGQAATPTAATGTQAPAATTAPAAPAALVLQADTVLGPKNLTEAERPLKTCIQVNKFAHNEQIVWRVRVVDGAIGKPLDDQALTSIELRLPDETLKLKYGPHGRPDPLDYFWTVSWMVPEGYPTGTVPYTLVATGADGRTGTFEQFKIPFAMLTVTDEVRSIIPE